MKSEGVGKESSSTHRRGVAEGSRSVQAGVGGGGQNERKDPVESGGRGQAEPSFPLTNPTSLAA